MPGAYVMMQVLSETSETQICRPNVLVKPVIPTAGGSAGIGKATALAFDKNGCKVAILGRRKERLDAVVRSEKHSLPAYKTLGHLPVDEILLWKFDQSMCPTPGFSQTTMLTNAVYFQDATPC